MSFKNTINEGEVLQESPANVLRAMEAARRQLVKTVNAAEKQMAPYHDGYIDSQLDELNNAIYTISEIIPSLQSHLRSKY